MTFVLFCILIFKKSYSMIISTKGVNYLFNLMLTSFFFKGLIIWVNILKTLTCLVRLLNIQQMFLVWTFILKRIMVCFPKISLILEREFFWSLYRFQNFPAIFWIWGVVMVLLVLYFQKWYMLILMQ